MADYIPRVRVKPYSETEWETLEPYTAIVDGYAVTIPQGFRTNGADIPRVLWSIYPPNSPEYFTAAVIHDYLCVTARNNAEIKQADEVLYRAMRVLECGKAHSLIFYYACRIWHTIKGAF